LALVKNKSANGCAFAFNQTRAKRANAHFGRLKAGSVVRGKNLQPTIIIAEVILPDFSSMKFPGPLGDEEG
jgi:hypothetical protein